MHLVPLERLADELLERGYGALEANDPDAIEASSLVLCALATRGERDEQLLEYLQLLLESWKGLASLSARIAAAGEQGWLALVETETWRELSAEDRCGLLNDVLEQLARVESAAAAAQLVENSLFLSFGCR